MPDSAAGAGATGSTTAGAAAGGSCHDASPHAGHVTAPSGDWVWQISQLSIWLFALVVVGVEARAFAGLFSSQKFKITLAAGVNRPRLSSRKVLFDPHDGAVQVSALGTGIGLRVPSSIEIQIRISSRSSARLVEPRFVERLSTLRDRDLLQPAVGVLIRGLGGFFNRFADRFEFPALGILVGSDAALNEILNGFRMGYRSRNADVDVGRESFRS